MKINWKHLAATPGYKSLKAAMIHDIQNDINDGRRLNRKPFRDKHEFRKLFHWVINFKYDMLLGIEVN